MMKVTRVCPFTEVVKTREINVTEEELRRWCNGELIQNVMPHVSDDDREFLISGITEEVWNEAFDEQI